jgi:hypothetical protein
MRKSSRLLVALSLLLPLAAAAAAEELKPTCGSVGIDQVPEKYRKSSVVIPAGIEPSSFFDIGCAVKFRDNECASRQLAMDQNAEVFDYLSGEKIKAQEAFFVTGTDVQTPLGHGVVAFKEKAAAEKFVGEHKGTVMKWHEVVNLTFK